MNAAANVGWSNDPRGARHWAHIFAPQTSHEGGTVKGRPSLTPKEPAPVLDATAYSLSAIVSKVDDKLVPMLVTAESRSRDQRGDQPYSIAVMPLWSFHSLRNACIVLRFGLDPAAPGNDL